MAGIQSNRLLPLIGGLVLLMALFVALRACSQDPLDPVTMTEVPRAPAPDADSPAETIRTLTAEVASMRERFSDLTAENERLRREAAAREQHLGQEVQSRVERAIREQQSAREGERRHLDAVMARIDQLSGRVAELAEGTTPDAFGNGGDIPVGLGLRPDDAARFGPQDRDRIVWIDPVGYEAGPRDTARVSTGQQRRQDETRVGRVADRVKLPDPIASHVRLDEQKPTPVYTVPRNATLIGSTAMTALVGRIPVRGAVQDPMPFKVITGPENLAANGITIPGVEGMIWSGTAVGDWTLSCVRGRLTSVTFVFEDGTIRTLPDPAPADEGGAGTDEPIGWISDARGYPCISGERITNAPAFLAQRIGLVSVQAAAEAAATAQTTTTVESGAATSAVTGDQTDFILGRTVSGGAAEVAEWLRERQEQSFDAVFATPGVELAIHVDRELRIDYDPLGRKVRHDHFTNETQSYQRLSLD